MGRMGKTLVLFALSLGAVMVLGGCFRAALSTPDTGSTAVSIQQVPAGVSEVTVAVSASDMDTIEVSVDSGVDAVALDVPVGDDREFTATAGLFTTSVVRDVPVGGVEVALVFAELAPVTVSFGTILATVGNFTLTVSGSDMADISRSVSAGTSTVDLDVPVGEAREFVAESSSGLFRASTTVDVPSGGVTVELTFVELDSEPDSGPATVTVGFENVPAGLSEFTLTVSGSDMSDITETVSAGTSSVELSVPVGTDRTFVAESSDGLYRVETTQDIPAGATSIDLAFPSTAATTVSFDFSTDISSVLDDYTVTVSGSGMSDVTETVTAGETSTSVDVPIGTNRTFTVRMPTTTTTSQSPVVAFGGSGSADVPYSGATLSLSIGPTETAIVAPDPDFSSRLVQVDDMSGTNWTTLQPLSSSAPYDVGFGPAGRMYLAVQGDTGVVRYDSIGGSGETELVGFSGVQAIAVDQANSLVYFGGGGEVPFLREVGLSGGTAGTVGATFLSSSYSSDGIWGIAVDESGYIYVSGVGSDQLFNNFDGTPTVAKIDPDNPAAAMWEVVLSDFSTREDGSGQADVMYQNGKLFVTNPSGTDGYKIVELDPDDGTIIDHFGSYPDDPGTPTSGEFYGPRRFVAIVPDRIHVVDEGDIAGNSTDNRLVLFDEDLDPAGTWETYGTEGSGTDEFDFFSQY